VSIGDLAAGNIYFLWIHRVVPVGQVASPNVRRQINWEFDAA
jgi:hypothetical protein